MIDHFRSFSRGSVPFDALTYTRATRIGSGPLRARRGKFRDAARWWRAPLWLIAAFTGAKSFADNPVLGSKRLNQAGLHASRVRAAHRLAAFRRARIAHEITPELREAFDRDGFVAVPDVLPPDQFAELREAVLNLDMQCRSHQQGDTVTTRLPVGPELLQRLPALARLLESSSWKGLMRYAASTRAAPLYYIQAIAGGVSEGPPDPQLELHSDTFHPSMKAWLFLTDVAEEGRPLTYVAGSHRLTRERLAWEKQRSVEIADADRLSQRGSLRVRPNELAELGLPQPTHFVVAANTLVVADTCGFHARADSHQATIRIELWAFCRRSPFLPWTGLDLLSWKPIAVRQTQWLAAIVDWLDRRGWKKQQWRAAGSWRDAIRR